MNSFRNILVGVDLLTPETLVTRDVTEASRQAVSQAIWLARRMEAQLTFNAVLPRFMSPSFQCVPDWYSSEFQVNVRRFRDDAAAALQELVDQASRETCGAGYSICYGDAWLELIRTAVRDSHDLIVVGSRDDAELSRLFLGSTAVKLLRKAPTAVWITHPRNQLEITSVVAATDFSSTAENAAKAALQVATACSAHLHLVHVCHEGLEVQMWGGQRSPVQREELYRAACGEAQAQMDREIQRLHGAGVSVEVTGDVKWGDAAQAVLGAAIDRKADLLVLGSVGRTGLMGVLIGNTAERILREVDRSLLVIKPDDFKCPVPLDHAQE